MPCTEERRRKTRGRRKRKGRRQRREKEKQEEEEAEEEVQNRGGQGLPSWNSEPECGGVPMCCMGPLGVFCKPRKGGKEENLRKAQ